MTVKLVPTRYSAARGRRGYILIMTSLSLTFLLGICGLAIDIGRMYIAKNEAQAYTDSAALAAARKLDGTSTGITNALTAVTTDTGKWRFDTMPFTNRHDPFRNVGEWPL
jgi:uncharacterized membrane protein